MDFKKIKPILQTKKKPKVTDPVRFPRVINNYEDQSKRDFAKSIHLEGMQLNKMMLDFI